MARQRNDVGRHMETHVSNKEILDQPSRLNRKEDHTHHVPVHVVWEITLACNLKCQHCGSRAGRPRTSELSTEESIALVHKLADMGTREISLIGGEAYLRRDWIDIIRAIKSRDIYCAMQTGGRNLTDKRLSEAREAGLDGIGISIDGIDQVHDKMRGVPGSYIMALDAMKRAKDMGYSVSCNTTVTAHSLPQMEELMNILIEAGATHWQIQIAVAMGNAVDNDEILLQPYQIGELIPLLSRLSLEGRERGLLIIPGNNVGYYGPHEHILRGAAKGVTPYWTGCAAGRTGMGIEADGAIKGCPSLATDGYSGGTIREKSVEEIWNTSDEVHFGRMRQKDSLWGFCKGCYYADACKGGCTWTSGSLLGKPGNNPYCHYRVLELEKQGLRERIVKLEDAPDKPFSSGLFDLIIEPIPGRNLPIDQDYVSPRLAEDQNPHLWQKSRHLGIQPPKLEICRHCNCYVWPHETDCPHCSENLETSRRKYQQIQLSLQRLESLLGTAPVTVNLNQPSLFKEERKYE